MDEARPTLHLSRRIERPVRDVVGEIETFLTLRGWHAVDGIGPGRGPAPLRAFRGVLRRRSGRPIARVELEVSAWSERASQLGLRPVGARAARAARRTPYGEAAATLLDGLAEHSPLRVPAPGRAALLLRRAS